VRRKLIEVRLLPQGAALPRRNPLLRLCPASRRGYQRRHVSRDALSFFGVPFDPARHPAVKRRTNRHAKRVRTSCPRRPPPPQSASASPAAPSSRAFAPLVAPAEAATVHPAPCPPIPRPDFSSLSTWRRPGLGYGPPLKRYTYETTPPAPPTPRWPSAYPSGPPHGRRAAKFDGYAFVRTVGDISESPSIAMASPCS